MFVWDSGVQAGGVVLLLHGTPSPSADWLPVAERLAQRYRVLIPDLPGYGRSPALGDSSMESVGDAIAAMLADKGIDRLHGIVGYSTGAYRSFDLVVRHSLPTKVIVSLAGMASFDEAGRAMRRDLADQIEADPTVLDSDALRGVMRDLMLSGTWRREHPVDEQRVIGWLRTTTPAALVAELRALVASRDLHPELSRIDAFVYARVGDADVGAPPVLSRAIIAAVPHGALEVVPGCGHALLIEDLIATTNAIETQMDARG